MGRRRRHFDRRKSPSSFPSPSCRRKRPPVNQIRSAIAKIDLPPVGPNLGHLVEMSQKGRLLAPPAAISANSFTKTKTKRWLEQWARLACQSAEKMQSAACAAERGWEVWGVLRR